MKKLLILLSLFALTAWSLPEAHYQANRTLVNVGEWCSGTVIAKDRVVTAAHCLPRIREDNYKALPGQPYGYKFFEPVTVTRHILDMEGNEVGKIEYKTEVYKYDELHDVAILVNVSEVRFSSWIRINTTPVKFGDRLFTIGNPHMWYGVVATGYVVKPKAVPPWNKDLVLILHNTPSAPGSSGGGLFNDKGELIGLTNWGIPDTPYKMAIPIKWMVKLLND